MFSICTLNTTINTSRARMIIIDRNRYAQLHHYREIRQIPQQMPNETQTIHLKFGSVRSKQETAATTKKLATLHRPTYHCHAKQYLESTHSRLLFINRTLFLDVLYDLFAIGNVDMENAPRHPLRLRSIPHKRLQKNIDVSQLPRHRGSVYRNEKPGAQDRQKSLSPRQPRVTSP